MPRFILPTPGLNDSVVRPVMVGVTSHICDVTGIPKDTRMYMPGGLETIAQAGSVMGESGNQELPRLPNGSKLVISVTEQPTEESYGVNNVLRADQLFLFHDKSLEISLRPVYASTEAVIEFQYRTTDRDSAQRWINEIRTKIMQGRECMEFSIQYHYLLPLETIYILQKLHGYREAVSGYGEDFDTYFKKYVTPRARLVTNVGGTLQQWAIGETKGRVIGRYNFDGVPDQPDKNDDGGSWVTRFSFKFQYDKPISCAMEYPIVIHNQLIDTGLRPEEFEQPPLTQYDRATEYNWSGSAYHEFETGVELRRNMADQGLTIPPYDEFKPTNIVVKTRRIYTAMIQLLEDNPHLIMNLVSDLVGYEFVPDMLTIIKGEAKYMHKPYDSILNITLYRNHDQVDYNTLSVDSDLNINCSSDLSLRYYYHLRFSVVTDLTLLSKDALDRLRNYGDAAKVLIEYIYPGSTSDKVPKTVGDGKLIPSSEITKIIDKNNGSNTELLFNTVQYLIIEVHPNADHE